MMGMTGWSRRVAAALLLAGLLAAALPGASLAAQQGQGVTFGLVDSDRIIDEYLAEELREPLQQATQELQAEFDRESEGLDDQAKERLFYEYQARLDAIREALIQERLPKIQNAIREVAEANGINIVIDSSAIHYGGVDLTDQVLARLGVVAARP